MKKIIFIAIVTLGGSTALQADLEHSLETLLIISEVADPADTWQARFVEIYNPGPDTIDFSGDTWYLSRQSNGSTTWGDILLTGIIAPGECHVVAYSTSAFNTAYGFDPDQSSGTINGNGDDGYFLFHGGDHGSGTLVDAYGVMDQSGAGEPWEYLDTKATRNHDQLAPAATWDSTAWTINLTSGTASMTPATHRETVTWNGFADDDWDNDTNWSFPGALSFIPDASNNIIVPAGLVNYPGIVDEAYCHDITLEASPAANASLTGVQFLLANGTASVQRYMSGGTTTRDDPDAVYHFAASPVDSTLAINVFPPTAYVRLWDEVNQEWINLTASDQLLVGKGYSVWLEEGDTIVTYSGLFNRADVSTALTYTTGGTPNPDYDGYNLVGNPFPSGLDWDTGAWVKQDLDASIAIWDGGAGNYIYWNGIVGGISNGIIPPCQGFFVRANSSSPSLTIPLDACVHSNTLYYDRDEPVNGLIMLSVAGGEYDYRDEVYIGFQTISTTAFDGQFDAIKLPGLEKAPQLYTKNDNGQQMAINFMPPEENMEVPLCFSNGYEGNFILKADDISGLPGHVTIILEDLKFQTQVDLRQTPEYEFFYEVGDDPERFMLIITGLVGIKDLESNPEATVIGQQQQIMVLFGGDHAEVFLYNPLGQLLGRYAMVNEQMLIPVNGGSGYIIRISGPGYGSTHKIFVK